MNLALLHGLVVLCFCTGQAAMKCRVLKLRQAGVAIPKYKYWDWPLHDGVLTIMDTKDKGLNRTVKISRFAYEFGAGRKMGDLLYEPHIVWLNEGRFTLAGFERVASDNGVVEYAQSWLVHTEERPPMS